MDVADVNDPYTVESPADLPSAGVPSGDCYGPESEREKGDVIAFVRNGDRWYVRLARGSGPATSIFEIARGEAFVLNVRGHVYWIDPSKKIVQLIPSRYESFVTKRLDEDNILAYDFQDLCLIDRKGLRWRDDGLVGDGIELCGSDAKSVWIEGWKDHPNNVVRLRVSLSDGSVQAS